MTESSLPNIYDLTLPELEQLMQSWKVPLYRARQIYRQLYVNLVASPSAMTDLPAALRERLASELRWGTLELVQHRSADDDQTSKALFRLQDGEVVESVLMIYPDRATVCVSTQAGCAMGCVFCATGRLGLLRNLTPGQIVEQVLWAARILRGRMGGGLQSRDTKAAANDDWWSTSTQEQASQWPERLTNVVFMGMGEPFANYDRWWQAVERLHDPQGLNMGARSLTVSTVGLVPGIRRLAEERLSINLAISLHAPDDALRTEMMPINKRYPLAELLGATRDYLRQTNRRVSFEYVLLQGRNDTPQHADALARLLRGEGDLEGLPLHLCHVNLIPWNPVPGMPLGRSEWGRVLDFQRVLQERGIACTVRVERGIAIAAACGQLAGTSGIIALEQQNVAP